MATRSDPYANNPYLNLSNPGLTGVNGGNSGNVLNRYPSGTGPTPNANVGPDGNIIYDPNGGGSQTSNNPYVAPSGFWGNIPQTPPPASSTNTGATVNLGTINPGITGPGGYTPPAGGTGQPVVPPSGQFSKDPNYIRLIVKSWGQQPGVNPSIINDPDYWVQAITNSGGLGPTNLAYWQMRSMQPEGAPAGSTGTGSIGGGAGISGPPDIKFAGTGGASSDSAQNTLYNMLMTRAKQGLGVDKNDPIVRGQVDAYGAAQTRAERNYLSGLAERAGPHANISAETRSANEQIGQSTSAFQAQVMQSELTARRNEIQQALTGMQGMLTAEQANQLQLQLAQINDALARAQLGQQAFQFDVNNQNVLGGFPAH